MAFREESKKLKRDATPQESAQQLRFLIKTGLLKYSDIQNHPERFFEAHRMVLGGGLEVNENVRSPGFGVRFTVQFNLWAGSIFGLCVVSGARRIRAGAPSSTRPCCNSHHLKYPAHPKKNRGDEKQVAMLDNLQREGALGCFCLTEKFAGVNSGLVVQTTATWKCVTPCAHHPHRPTH